MMIGPLTSQPPTAAFTSSFIISLSTAGVLGGTHMLLPTDIGADGAVEYSQTDVDFVPMIDSSGEISVGGGVYERLLSSEEDATTPFVDEFRLVEGALSWKAKSLAAPLRHARILSKDPPVYLDRVIEGLEEIGDVSLRDLAVGGQVGPREDGRFAIRRDFAIEAAEAMDFAASAHMGARFSAPPHVVAEISMLAGALHAKMSDPQSVERAVDSFSVSSSMYSEAGFHVAAALAAEIAAAPSGRVSNGSGEAAGRFVEVAKLWLVAAQEIKGSDEDGTTAALYRGILAAIFAKNRDAAATTRALHRTSAELYAERGLHLYEGREYLREALSVMIYFSGTSDDWSAMAELLSLAGRAFEEVPNTDELLIELERLENISRSEAEALSFELSQFDGQGGEGHIPSTALARSRVKFQHGDMFGALADLSEAHGVDPNNPEILAEIGFIYHHLMDFHAQGGRRQQGRVMLYTARKYLDDAFAAAGAKGANMALLLARSGAIYVSMGNLKRGRWELKQALTIDPNNREIRDYVEAVEMLGLAQFAK